ncbi:hypothetical protein CVT26_005432 [Gymnopilus dilepis]|uniref:Uncharacterized protein n=1 Tax=Gymnopilus dilepis TaxID=231916 RepID=A0A409W8K4_9AGAR|nr:hypothetical protein CVT26_005432 [Gymnopilus dilepis]
MLNSLKHIVATALCIFALFWDAQAAPQAAAASSPDPGKER